MRCRKRTLDLRRRSAAPGVSAPATTVPLPENWQFERKHRQGGLGNLGAAGCFFGIGGGGGKGQRDKEVMLWCTFLETNISPEKSILKMIFLFPRWDMLVP